MPRVCVLQAHPSASHALTAPAHKQISDQLFKTAAMVAAKAAAAAPQRTASLTLLGYTLNGWQMAASLVTRPDRLLPVRHVEPCLIVVLPLTFAHAAGFAY